MRCAERDILTEATALTLTLSRARSGAGEGSWPFGDGSWTFAAGLRCFEDEPLGDGHQWVRLQAEGFDDLGLQQAGAAGVLE